MNVDFELIDNTLKKLTGSTIDFLSELIKIPSTRGNEGPVNRLIHSIMRNYCDDADLMQIPESFKEDPLYSWSLPNITYKNTQNLRLQIFGSQPESSKSILFNTHSDVVPPSKDQNDPFTLKLIDNVIYGRGACDAKGQIAVLYLLLRCLKELKLRPKGNLVIDIVVEEENGGNGTLFMVRNPKKTDAAIVLEPTEKKIYAATRGAVWFEVTCFGKAGHSGKSHSNISALKKAIKAIQIIEEYHDYLLSSSRGMNRLFDKFKDPMPVTFGTLHAGNWPSITPSKASFKGVFGFLPNNNINEVQKGIEIALSAKCINKDFIIEFNMLNNEGCEISEHHPLTKTLKLARQDIGKEYVVSAFTASCDAWRYNNQLNIPTVVFGAGSLAYAHSKHEQILINEIIETTKTLLYFIDRWSGFDK